MIKEKKITLVDPSKDIAKSYKDKSSSNFRAAKLLLENQFLEESITITYFSMHSKAKQLLFLSGIKCVNHVAVILLLDEVFKINSKDLSFAKEERIDKQYYADFTIVKEDAVKLLEIANRFISTIDLFIDSNSTHQLSIYREEVKRTYF